MYKAPSEVGQKFPVKEETLAFVPAGTVHNFIDTGKTDLKLFTTYSPPNHAAGILQKTKAEIKGYVPKGAIEQEVKITKDIQLEF